MIPRTSDGRVLFAIPWHDRVVVGTTDDPVPRPEIEPRAMKDERDFLLSHVQRFLRRRPLPEEILSVWSGQRPLIRAGGNTATKAISREHTLLVSRSKLITISGGKWTTYRKMAQDATDHAAIAGGLPRVPSVTPELRLHGWSRETTGLGTWDSVYGSDLPALNRIRATDPALQSLLHPNLPVTGGEVIWAARFEMARCVEDVLARRTRCLFLDARSSIEAAPEVARILAHATRP